MSLKDKGSPKHLHKSPAPQPQLPPTKRTLVPTENQDGIATGETPGFFGVTPDGAATYNIPLWVPPGRNGMQPDLALGYDSRVGYGLMGVGWRLDGIHTITRCSKSFSVDGYVQAVQFDEYDAFCLDGERMVSLGQNIAMNGSEYRTRHDQFAKILISGVDTLGPLGFLVYEKNGRILTFEADPQIERRVEVTPSGATPDPHDITTTEARYSWSLRSIEDRNANIIQIDYAVVVGAPGSVMKDEYLPTQVRYTGCSDGSRNLDPLRSVRFFYGAHPEETIMYVSGLPLRRASRLERIEMWGPDPTGTDVLLRLYEITYRNDSITGRSLVTTISECDGLPMSLAFDGQATPTLPLGAVTGVRKRPHVFSWELGKSGFRDVPTGITDVKTIPRDSSDAPSRLLALDLNGDGFDDLIYVAASSPDKFAFRIFDPITSNFGPINPTDIDVPSNLDAGQNPLDYRLLPIDFDMDGRMDLISAMPQALDEGAVTWEFSRQLRSYVTDLATGASQLSPRSVIPMQLVEVVDIDGDRLPELLGSPIGQNETSERAWYVGLSGESSAYAQLPISMPSGHLILDVDGDGAMEILFVGGNRVSDGAVTLWGTRYLGFGVGRDGKFRKQTFAVNLFQDKDYTFVDLNGDGLLDAVASNPNGDRAHTCVVTINTGNGFLPEVAQPLTVDFEGAARRVLSYRADGKQDVLLRWAHGARNSDVGTSLVILSWKNGQLTATKESVQTSPMTVEELELFEVADFNGDGLDDFVMMNNGELHLYLHEGKMPDMLTEIVDTLGCHTSISYEPITNKAVYNDISGCEYPLYASNRARWVVATVTTQDGIGGWNTEQYTYEDGRTDLRGDGFLGFLSREVTNVQTGTKTRITYNSDTRLETPLAGPFFVPGQTGSMYPFVGLPVDAVTTTPLDAGAQRVHRVHTTYLTKTSQTDRAVFSYPQEIDIQVYEDGPAGIVQISRTTTTQDFDEYGNLLFRDTAWSEGGEDSYKWTYDNDPNTWIIGLLTFSELRSISADGTSVTRRTAYEYDLNGQLTREIVEPGELEVGFGYRPLTPQSDGVQTLFISYDRRPEGMIERVRHEEATDLSGSKRVLEYTFDSSEHMFPVSIVNALGHRIRASYHPGLGAPCTIEDENGVQTVFDYDGFGRIRMEGSPGGYALNTSYLSTCNLPPTTLSVTVSSCVHVIESDGTEVSTAYDILGRPVLVKILARQDDRVVLQQLKYDALGQVAQISRPYFANGNADYTTYSHDLLARVRKMQYSDGTRIAYTYTGRELTEIDCKGHRRSHTFDERGRITNSSEVGPGNLQLFTIYGYAAFDLPAMVTDAAGNITEWSYDRLGRVIEELDPDSGQRLLGYNPFGENVTEMKGIQMITYNYDNIGRIFRIDRPEGMTTLTWDTAPHGIGSLSSVVTPDHVRTIYRYDIVGRPSFKTWEINNHPYTIGFTYDSAGRLAGLVYPKAVAEKPPLQIQYVYGNHGALMTIVDGQTGKPYWTRLETDATQQFGLHEFGNGVKSRWIENSTRPGILEKIWTRDHTGRTIQHLEYGFDLNCNLSRRTDYQAGTSEGFEHDILDRLQAWSRGKLLPSGKTAWKTSVSWEYDGVGNISRRSVLVGGGYNVSYTYGDGAGPHAVTSSTVGVYKYDGRGNQIEAPGRQVEYTSFDLPSSITTKGLSLALRYDGEGKRVLLSSPQIGDLVCVGDIYESKPNEYHRFFIVGPEGVIAEVVWTEAAGLIDAEDVLYFHNDHLGSVGIVTDAAGHLAEQLVYDPWGLPIVANQFTLNASKLDERVDLGFTGHKYESEFQLIDMVARWYDPVTGRFLSPDPFRLTVSSGQGLNPYSYVYNDPVSWRDPTGLQAADGEGRYTWQDVDLGGTWGMGTVISRINDAGSVESKLDGDVERGNFTAAGSISNHDGRGGAGIRDVNTSAVTVSTNQVLSAIRAPGFWGGLIPVYGSGRMAINDFQTGHPVWGTINAGLSISDIFLVKSLVNTVGKVGFAGLIKVGNSQTWGAAKSWMVRKGWREFSGQHFHHWAIPQRGWGSFVPGFIKNQPWNIMRMAEGRAGQIFHNAIEGKGEAAMGLAGRLWYGSPTWVKVALGDAVGKTENSLR